ncbi:MAG: sulfite exporter TauE/SafE family protein [Granulosicoccaceae bacterium]
MIDLTLGYGVLLVVLGLVAGVINTLAGGGSNLTIPALMVAGLPPDVANATNRVGVMMQSLTGMKQFHAKGKLPTADLNAILVPTLLGGLLGAAAASYAPAYLLKPALLFTMLAMAALMLFKPSVVIPDAGTAVKLVKDTPGAWLALFVAGIYGGFVQAGVGFVLIAALAGTLRYDIISTNALKIVCTVSFTAVALALFIYNDQVAWAPGLLLAIGSMVGAWLGVNIAMDISAKVMKWFLFLMTLVAVIAAMLN